MSLKLLIDTKRERVLFAEAGKEFVDFLFTLMSLPVGTVISLLSSNDMVGSLGKVYQSIENISNTYTQPNMDKGTLLNSKIAAVHNKCGIVPPLLPNKKEILSAGEKMYICLWLGGTHSSMYGNGHHRFVAQDSTATCPQCNTKMSTEVNFVAGSINKKDNDSTSASSSGEGDGGFVKGVFTYMVMDDLEVTPMSTISSIDLLNKFNVKEVGALQEKRVSIGKDEVCKYMYMCV